MELHISKQLWDTIKYIKKLRKIRGVKDIKFLACIEIIKKISILEFWMLGGL